MTNVPYWQCPPGESCGSCGEPIEKIWNYEEAPPIGDRLGCLGCGAVHVVEADGVRYTGEHDAEFVRHEATRIVFGDGGFSG